jgi:hypothetical protein
MCSSPIVLKRCGPAQLRSQAGDCLDACADSACASPPCYCNTTGQDFCQAACPSFQSPRAEKVQIDEVVGTAVVCSCRCPVGSTNPKCADPNETPIAKQYDLGSDKQKQTVLTITEASGVTTFVVPGMASSPSGNAKPRQRRRKRSTALTKAVRSPGSSA